LIEETVNFVVTRFLPPLDLAILAGAPLFITPAEQELD
jgi:hypothetical protein